MDRSRYQIFSTAGLSFHQDREGDWMSWEELIAADPGLIFISTCGFDKTSLWPN